MYSITINNITALLEQYAFTVNQTNIGREAIIIAEPPEAPSYWVQVKIVDTYFTNQVQIILAEPENGCSIAQWLVSTELLPIVLQQAIALSNHHSVESIA